MRFWIWSNWGCCHVPVGALDGMACGAADGVEGAERDMLESWLLLVGFVNRCYIAWWIELTTPVFGAGSSG